MSTLYFAYGSNLNRKQMASRCPGSKPVGLAQLLDYQLEFWEWAQVVATPGSAVHGAIYMITPEDELALDTYEGYTATNPAAGEYQKITIPVMTAQGPVMAMLYIMNPRTSQRPSNQYYDVIRQGYKDWGMNDAPLRNARNRAVGMSDTEFGEH
jgi:gamma-glutamylcyclotransferase (GGCT)/AIG2-like uncharacterized protein YtfP